MHDVEMLKDYVSTYGLFDEIPIGNACAKSDPMKHDFERCMTDLHNILSDQTPLNMNVQVDDDYVFTYGLFDELLDPSMSHFEVEGVCSNIMEEKEECELL